MEEGTQSLVEVAHFLEEGTQSLEEAAPSLDDEQHLQRDSEVVTKVKVGQVARQTGLILINLILCLILLYKLRWVNEKVYC